MSPPPAGSTADRESRGPAGGAGPHHTEVVLSPIPKPSGAHPTLLAPARSPNNTRSAQAPGCGPLSGLPNGGHLHGPGWNYGLGPWDRPGRGARPSLSLRTAPHLTGSPDTSATSPSNCPLRPQFLSQHPTSDLEGSRVGCPARAWPVSVVTEAAVARAQIWTIGEACSQGTRSSMGPGGVGQAGRQQQGGQAPQAVLASGCKGSGTPRSAHLQPAPCESPSEEVGARTGLALWQGQRVCPQDLETKAEWCQDVGQGHWSESSQGQAPTSCCPGPVPTLLPAPPPAPHDTPSCSKSSPAG